MKKLLKWITRAGDFVFVCVQRQAADIEDAWWLENAVSQTKYSRSVSALIMVRHFAAIETQG